MARTTSRGHCRYCKGEYGKSGMTRHLQACAARQQTSSQAVAGKAPTARLLHLVVSGQYLPMYWMHLEVPEGATLDELDGYLRHAWLECCGHLSAFEIRGVSYSSSGYSGWGDDRTINVKLGHVLEEGMEFTYKYDFGSTTHLKLKVVDKRKGPLPPERIELLAQNEPPSIPCGECGQEATQICSECSWSGEGCLCDSCAATHECGEEMLLPVVNSPRVGVCGYSG